MKLPIRFLLFYAVTAIITLLVLFTLARAQQNQQGVTQFYLVGSASTAAKVTGTAVLCPGVLAPSIAWAPGMAPPSRSRCSRRTAQRTLPQAQGGGGVFTANALTNFTWARGYIEGIVTAAGSSTGVAMLGPPVPSRCNDADLRVGLAGLLLSATGVRAGRADQR